MKNFQKSKHESLVSDLYSHPISDRSHYKPMTFKILSKNSPIHLKESLKNEKHSLVTQRNTIKKLFGSESPRINSGLGYQNFKIIGKSEKFDFPSIKSNANSPIYKAHSLRKFPSNLTLPSKEKLISMKKPELNNPLQINFEIKTNEKKIIPISNLNFEVSENEEADESWRFTSRYFNNGNS